MKKGADAFRSIGEVAKLIGVAPHVLRYWETQFPQLKPMKRPDGRRYYRPEDVRLVAGLCEVLRDDGMTIRGAKKMMSRDRGDAIRARGLARLGDRLDIAAMASDSAAGRGSDDSLQQMTAEDAGQAAPRANDPVIRTVAADHDDTDLDEETQDMAAHTPRSRHRRRAAHGGDQRALPLFPDLDGSDRGSAWLARLAMLAAALRDLPSAPTAPPLLPRRLADLRDLIASHY